MIARRRLLFLLGAVAGSAALDVWRSPSAISLSLPGKQEDGPFTLPPLPYEYSALAPTIDAETMQLHHDLHHAGYVKNLNAAVSDYPALRAMSPEELIEQLDSLPEDAQAAVRNNGGGHLNHSMFWEIMSPDGGGEPVGAIADAIASTFGSFDEFKSAFNEEGKKRFGSGWAWLVLNGDQTLQVTNTGNQDSPLMNGLIPIMGNDVWEHAYYLNYRNRRAEYLDAWWNVVNWPEVNRRYEMAMA